MTFSAMAQVQKQDRKHAHKEWNKEGKRFKGDHFEKLHLNEDQKAQMKLLKQSFRQQMREVSKSGTPEEQKEKRRQLAKEHKDKIRAILTPEQKQQAAELMKEHKARGRDGKSSNKLNDFTKDLHLTSEQSSKIAALNSTFKTNLKDLKNNAALTTDQKKEQRKSLMKKHRTDIHTLLTSEQKEQLKNRRKKQPNSQAVK